MSPVRSSLILAVAGLLIALAIVPAADASHACRVGGSCCDVNHTACTPGVFLDCTIGESFWFSHTDCNVQGIQANSDLEYCPALPLPFAFACATTELFTCTVDGSAPRCVVGIFDPGPVIAAL